jgi:sporulation protein YlmC with PRC-barrel domain
MKQLLLGTAITLAGVLPAMAQDMFRPSSDASLFYASDFIGMRVYAAETAVEADAFDSVQDNWNDIGEINDLILARDGSVEAVLVDIGGFLGIGERQVAVDMSAIRFVADSSTADYDGDFFLVLNANRALIEGAPAYERNVLPTTTTDANPAPTTTGTMATDGTATATDGAAATTGAAGTTMATDGTVPTAGATGTATDGTAATAGTTGMAADGTAPSTMREGYAAADFAQITTEELTGLNVYGENDESLGVISNFVLGADNSISHVVVDVGGFLGIGTKPVAIDADALQVLRADGDGSLRAYVSMTRDEIEQLPDAEL